jgi:hypothetical protein
MIERGKDDGRNECHPCHGLNDLLALFLFCSRPCLHPSLQQNPKIPQEIPTPASSRGPSRKEHQSGKGDEKHQEREERFLVQVFHFLTILHRRVLAPALRCGHQTKVVHYPKVSDFSAASIGRPARVRWIARPEFRFAPTRFSTMTCPACPKPR